jgi:hemolysin III
MAEAPLVPTPLLLLSLQRTSSSALLSSFTPRTAGLPSSQLATSIVPSARVRPDRYHHGSVKPVFRGVMHELLAYTALPYTAVLLQASYPSPRVLLSSSIYACSLLFALVASACYHRVVWRDEWREELSRKLDHVGVFIVGAGSGTPFALLLLREPTRAAVLLALLWLIPLIAAVRVATRNCAHLTRLDDCLHVLHPLLTAPFLAATFSGLPSWLAAMVVGTWVLYGVGFTVFVLERPVLSPKWFGYHELFHTIISSAFVLSMAAQLCIAKTAVGRIAVQINN